MDMIKDLSSFEKHKTCTLGTFLYHLSRCDSIERRMILLIHYDSIVIVFCDYHINYIANVLCHKCLWC